MRTPLTALRLQLEELASASDSPDRELAATRLRAGIDRSARLVEQLLALARQERRDASASVRVELQAIAREVIEELVPLADRKRIDLGLDATAGPSIVGDPHAIATLLRNLIDNALAYTPDGGHVDVRIRSDDVDRERPVVLEVVDDGPGIPIAGSA